MSKGQWSVIIATALGASIIAAIVLIFASNQRSQSTIGQPTTGDKTDCNLAGQLYVAATIDVDLDSDPSTNSTDVFLADSVNPEAPLNCPASVVIIGPTGMTQVPMVATGRYRAADDSSVQIKLDQGKTYALEIDLENNGTIDANGTLTLSDINPGTIMVDFLPPGSTESVQISWQDGGTPDRTATYWQLSDSALSETAIAQGQFATGCAEGSLIPSSQNICERTTETLTMGPGQKAPFFKKSFSKMFGRWQTQTIGELTGATGRFDSYVHYDSDAACWFADDPKRNCTP